MPALLAQHRPLGETGLTVPPVVFGTSALGNVGRVITEQSKLAICGEWFQHVATPVMAEIAYEHGDGMALEVLGRMLRRMEICGEEIIVQLSFGRGNGAGESYAVQSYWEKSCRLLGEHHLPKLISVGPGSEEGWRAARKLKEGGLVCGVGLEFKGIDGSNDLAAADPDWIALRGGFTILRHSPQILALMADLARRQIPVIVAGVFEGGFLVGGNRFDGRVLGAENAADRSLLAWRKSFVALCDGHGISPVQACIQFVLSAPGVVAVVLESSYADRVAENVSAMSRKTPPNFWQSMKEEGLLGESFPIGV